MTRLVQSLRMDSMINLDGCRISLDRREHGSDIDFISHAHSDHVAAAKSSKEVLSSRETEELLHTAYGIRVNPHMGNGFELLDSGHMLGSKQLYIKDIGDGRSLSYSGDYQMRKSMACNPIRTKHADIAVVDSTYPNRYVTFEDRDAVKERIQEWVLKSLGLGIVLFTAFRMGKAQDIISMFNEVGIKPIVSRKINEINKVYMRNGIPLDYASVYENDDHESIMSHNFVGIVETRNINTLANKMSSVHGRHVYTAVATGLAKEFNFSYDMQFPLSSHADFQQAVEYIERVNADTVLTYGSRKSLMAQSLSEFGIEAEPFYDINANSLNKLIINESNMAE